MTDNTFMIIAISFQTMVFIPTYACARHPDNFHHPDEFIPDRWLEDEVNKFGSLPFSFGARMCIGRRVAELEIRIALAHVSDVWSQVYFGNVRMCILPFSILCPDYKKVQLVILEHRADFLGYREVANLS